MKRWYTGLPTDVRTRRPRFIRLFQIRLSRLMLLIAMAAVVFAAWLFNRDYGSFQRAWNSDQILALNDSDAARRRQAAENLSGVEFDDLTRTVSALVGALADPDWHVRYAAAHSLASAIGSHGGITNDVLIEHIELAVRALIPACDDPCAEVRIEAMQTVGMLYESSRVPGWAGSAPVGKPASGLGASRACDTLTRALQDKSPHVRCWAVWSFARVGRICGAIADPVIDIVEHDSDQNVRIAAVDALSEGWPDDPRLYSLLLRRLRRVHDQDEHAHIGWTIGGLGRPPLDALPALLEALSTGDRIVRDSIMVALGKLGEAGRPALPDLARIARIELADADPRCPAIEALRSIDPDSPEAQALIEPLAALLRDSPWPFQREKAMAQLKGFGRSAAAAVGTLRDAQKSVDPDVRRRAIDVLSSIGPSATSAIGAKLR
jgi:HEAT repeat protein